jgi:hypothetical protein
VQRLSLIGVVYSIVVTALVEWHVLNSSVIYFVYLLRGLLLFVLVVGVLVIHIGFSVCWLGWLITGFGVVLLIIWFRIYHLLLVV